MSDPQAEPAAASAPMGAAASRPPVPLKRRGVSPAVAEFGVALRALTPRGFVTEGLIAVNVLVYLIMVVRGVSPMEPTIADLLAWGAGYGPLTAGGQPWRLLTATFLHIGALHLAMNMYVLWSAGRFVERLLGNAGFLILYLSAGLCGSVASVLWSPYVVSAGASGAVFGVYGALLGFVVRERTSIPGAALQSLQRSALLFVGYNLVFGLTVKGIDMAAHLGGLAGGFAGGLILAYPLDPAGAARRWRRNAVLAGVTVVAVLAAARTLPPRLDLYAEIDRFNAMEKRTLGLYNAAAGEARDGKLGDEALATEIDTRIVPEWHATRERFGAARGLPEAQATLVAALLAYVDAREEAFRLTAQAAHTHDSALMKKATEKQADAARLAKEIQKK